MRHLMLLLLPVSTGCLATDEPTDDTDTDGRDERADLLQCPGDPGCEVGVEGPLRAGVAVRSIVPDCFESWIDNDGNWLYSSTQDTFLDCGCDRLCPDDEGWPGADEGEGDGVFRPIWIAGFQNNKPAMGVRGAGQGFLGEGDGLDARALVLDQGSVRVALVTLDAVGWMYDDVLRMRQAVLDADLDVDHVIVHSSHSHAAPDSMGIYGPTLTTTGYDPEYAAQVDGAVLDAVSEAVAGLVEVRMSVGSADANDHMPGGVANIISDTRDPWIVDPRVGAARFADADGNTVATLVHFANHPETIASRNALLSSDFVHGARRVVAEGSSWSDDSGMDGVGGVTLYLNGTVGGMMTSLSAPVIDPTGFQPEDDSWDKADTVGQLVGELALRALADADAADAPTLRVGARSLFFPVENTGFQAMFQLGVLDHRSVYNYDADRVINDSNTPEAASEVDVLEVGPLRVLTVPGELLPENAIGGYDGRWTPEGTELVDPGNGLPPLLSEAPEGPYLHERIGGEHAWILGLGNDEVGYIIPPYDFVVGDVPYVLEPDDGDHYEETNSLGPETWPIYEQAALALIAWLDGE